MKSIILSPEIDSSKKQMKDQIVDLAEYLYRKQHYSLWSDSIIQSTTSHLKLSFFFKIQLVKIHPRFRVIPFFYQTITTMNIDMEVLIQLDNALQ